MVQAYKIRPTSASGFRPSPTRTAPAACRPWSATSTRCYWSLLKRFGELTGVPILINTSFNENEPIVNTPAQAIDCFLRTNMDGLAIGSFLVLKPATSSRISSACGATTSRDRSTVRLRPQLTLRPRSDTVRILFLNQTFHPDVAATAQQASDLAAKLVERGHDVTVLCSRRAYDSPGERYPRRESLARRRDPADLVLRFRKEGAVAARRRFRQLHRELLAPSGRAPPLRLVVAMTSPPLISWLAALVRARQGRPLRVLGHGPQSGRSGGGRLAPRELLDHEGLEGDVGLRAASRHDHRRARSVHGQAHRGEGDRVEQDRRLCRPGRTTTSCGTTRQGRRAVQDASTGSTASSS